ncbi:hypothetical protein HNV12_26875 [Methanococcoides sp. SA1]|nr:hypothetical protein [Methanococcoides sp. SA1]
MAALKEGIKKQAVLGLIYKFSALFLAYLTIPILINYLGNEYYGLWVTITSIFGWFTLLDFGLGTGLQNHLSASFTVNDSKLSRKLVSTTYGAMAFISLLIFIPGLIIINIVPANQIIDTLDLGLKEIRSIFSIMLVSTCILLFLNIYINICNALKRTSTALLAGLISQAGILAGIIIISGLGVDKPFTALTLTRNILNITVILGVTFILFRLYPQLKPGIRYFDKDLVKRVSGIGIQFFLIHICWAVINSTDNIIIRKNHLK